MVVNIEKLKNVLHYIISKVGGNSNVGKTVLYKLLYFSDFNYFELYEDYLTGEDYYKLDKGFAPKNFDNVVKELEQEKKIFTHKDCYEDGGYHYRYISNMVPNLDSFSVKEKEVIDEVLKCYSHMTAKKISEISHNDMPIQATENNKLISYQLVFYRSPEFSVREYSD